MKKISEKEIMLIGEKAKTASRVISQIETKIKTEALDLAAENLLKNKI